ncbi:hypothetical protein EB796_010372 [Bugula neritina]|uniref:Uncharacterized protein n=1 Tax=Bugula neritina TaxID=10212 RepID=A0A7J7JZF0_BUGNE|nr:hypothetical protein EB796_010372 [Bugula neritina]
MVSVGICDPWQQPRNQRDLVSMNFFGNQRSANNSYKVLECVHLLHRGSTCSCTTTSAVRAFLVAVAGI